MAGPAHGELTCPESLGKQRSVCSELDTATNYYEAAECEFLSAAFSHSSNPLCPCDWPPHRNKRLVLFFVELVFPENYRERRSKTANQLVGTFWIASSDKHVRGEYSSTTVNTSWAVLNQ